MFAAVDGYCERLGPGLRAEPLNAATIPALLFAALIMARHALMMARRACLPANWR